MLERSPTPAEVMARATKLWENIPIPEIFLIKTIMPNLPVIYFGNSSIEHLLTLVDCYTVSNRRLRIVKHDSPARRVPDTI